MNRNSVFCAVFLATFFTLQGHAQWKEEVLSISEILNESRADLIFVGTVNGYGRSYTATGRGNSTHVTYEISKVLKGKYPNAMISFQLSGHIGFGEGKIIVFATSDPARINPDSRTKCLETPCYLTVYSWSVPWSKVNEAKVVKAMSRK